MTALLTKLAEQRPLLVEFRFRGVRQRFRLFAGGDTALVVGSLAAADFRLTEPGILPVHFHFEYEDEGLYLVPTACAGRLRLNGTPVFGKRRVPRQALLEFVGQSLELGWRVAPETENMRRATQRLGATQRLVRLPGGTEQSRVRAERSAYAEALPADTDITRVGTPVAVDPAPTRRFAPTLPASLGALHSTSHASSGRFCAGSCSTGIARELRGGSTERTRSRGARCLEGRNKLEANDQPWLVPGLGRWAPGSSGEGKPASLQARRPNDSASTSSMPAAAPGIVLGPPAVWRNWPETLEVACRYRARSGDASGRACEGSWHPGNPLGMTGFARELLSAALGRLARLGTVAVRRPWRVIGLLGLAFVFGCALGLLVEYVGVGAPRPARFERLEQAPPIPSARASR